MNCRRRELVLTSGQFCVRLYLVILAEIVKSNHSSTLGVATLGESSLVSLLKHKYQDNLHQFLLQVSTTPYSDFNVCTSPCHARQ